ncbi:NosR/NirI family protein [Neisseria sp.]|uniref:NosR/NirI family protein n=1 Tax=Neisseria sp. TaxID=192066 RepID=UPI0026DD311A|nr:NosR/NirI family protein [Neisseria sp.]MDO4907580.1 4Fe-4S binding protein [Neisseria sp.]
MSAFFSGGVRIGLCIFGLLVLLLFPDAAYAERLPEFLKKIPPSEIFPNADRYGEPEGKPMAARVYKGQEQLGLVYITTDVVNTRGYSSKPIDTMVALANDGTIVGAKLVAHNEPIVLIGIPQSKVDKFIQDYVGLNLVKSPLKPGSMPSDIVSGATVTLMVINDSIQRSIKAVAAAYKLGTPQAAGVVRTASDETQGAASQTAQAAPQAAASRPRRAVNPDKQDVLSWEELLAQKAVAKLHLTVDEANKLFETGGKAAAAQQPEPGPGDAVFVDLYVALASQPAVGKSLLGEAGWNALQGRLKPNQSALVIAGEGRYSWKGSGYVRGGIFDRIEIIQGDTSFRFTDAQHERLTALEAAGAPQFKEVSLFTVPDDAGFDGAEPWRAQLVIQRTTGVHDKAFVTADLDYELPPGFYIDDPNAPPVEIPPEAAPVQTASADPAAAPEDNGAQAHLWKQVWAGKAWQIAVVSFSLLVLAAVFFFQDTLARYPVFYDRFRLAYLAFSLFFIGWYLQAQLSVVNVLTFTTSLRTGFSWDYFLMDPIVFILWSASAVSLLFWNRGAFCGWLCPFGAMQELSNRIAKKLGVKQINVPFGVHTRLAALKYVVFMVLFGVSLYDLGLAEQLSEIEPFKTAVILKFMREWWWVLFAAALLAAGLFIERFFCRYLCPLGAAMAIPARLRIFDWLRRYHMCGNPCQLCANECPVQAIHPEGEINPNECIQCLHCQVLYHHTTRCPQVVATLKKKAKQAAAKTETAAGPQEQVVRFVKKPPENNKCF